MATISFFITLVYTLVCANIFVIASPTGSFSIGVNKHIGVNNDIGVPKINIEKVENVYIDMAAIIDNNLAHLRTVLNETNHYKFGSRESGDQHMGDGNYDRHWDTPVDIPIYLVYSLANPNSKVTYVEISIDHNGTAGHPEMVRGGIHQSNIAIKIPLHGTKYVHATAAVYAKL